MNKTERKQGSQFLAGIGIVLALALSGGMAAIQEKTVPEMASQGDVSIPASSIERAEKDGTAYHISLKDLTKLALQNNLDIAISDTKVEG